MPPAFSEAMQTFSFTRLMHILIISVLLLRSETRVFDVCLTVSYSFIPGKWYVVKPWNFTDRRSISTPSFVSQSSCLVLHHIIFGGVTRWNRLKPVEAAHTHTHTHTHTALWGSFEMNGRRLGTAYQHLLTVWRLTTHIWVVPHNEPPNVAFYIFIQQI